MTPHRGRGRVADYIPALARVDGAAVRHRRDDRRWQYGERGRRRDAVLDPEHIEGVHPDHGAGSGREPTCGAGSGTSRPVRRSTRSSSSNGRKGIPRNPLINAGALVVTDTLLADADVPSTIARITEFMRWTADDPHRVGGSGGRHIRGRNRLSQREPGQFPARQRQSSKRAGGGARSLFQPVRAHDELPSARPRRALPCATMASIRSPTHACRRRCGPGVSTRS